MAQQQFGAGTAFRPGVASAPSTQLELRIACRGLLDLDVASKSDPVCIVYLKEMYSDRYFEVGRTEVIQNTLNPDFVKAVNITYNFEEHQKLRFDVYDWDMTHGRLDDQDYLGRMECSLGEIVAVQGTNFKRPVTYKPGWPNAGVIMVSTEEVSSCKEILTMQFSADGLDKKDFFGLSDPFLTFSRTNEDNSTTVIHKTEVIKNTLNPTWRTFSIPMRTLCNGDPHRTILIQCFDWDSDGGHDFIGEFHTNAAMLMKGSTPENVFECINPKKKAKKRHYKNSGMVRLRSCHVEKEYSFLDYIQGGTQLHFTVAVDFTASNGDPRHMTSLHYRNSAQPNQYMVAIRAVGEIISDYDNDKMFPALGFGAKLPPDGRVSHEFFLNGNPTNPYCQGVEGLLVAYVNTLQVVQLYGPTNFSPVINHVARFAASIHDGSAYFVLLIITDGVISDMLHTKKAIIDASSLPISIIIVGVGSADFSGMEELDADTRVLNVNGQYAQRDIVQFVPLRDILNPTMTWQQSQARLAKEVLAEIPTQLVTYMKRNLIVPRSVPSAPAPTMDAGGGQHFPAPSAPM